jgi:hypothetical protein
LVVSIHELVLKLSNLVDEHTELVGNIRDIVIARLAPDRQLLLHLDQPSCWSLDIRCTYRDFHPFSPDQFHGAHDILLHLHQLRKLLREIWAECARVDRLAECVACRGAVSFCGSHFALNHIPILAFPNSLVPLVEDEGGGGFWICDAVGARDWRIEYVRCMVAVLSGWKRWFCCGVFVR